MLENISIRLGTSVEQPIPVKVWPFFTQKLSPGQRDAVVSPLTYGLRTNPLAQTSHSRRPVERVNNSVRNDLTFFHRPIVSMLTDKAQASLAT